ncbi:MAG: DNA repair protein RecN [Wenzhouxiangellaceae bacterium]
MLRSLAIRNFTIIDSLELSFEPGFGAITGETGAGKSILIDALGQLLGDRAESTLVADGSRQADLTAGFELSVDHPARAWLHDQALDDDGELLLLRRVIPAEGASRAWINGHPAAIGQLREIGALLVEIHGQHEHQRLMDSSYQRAWLDRQLAAPVRDAVAEYARRFDERHKELEMLTADHGSDDIETMQFRLAELDRLDLQENEFEQLEVDQRRLASVDELQRAYASALEALTGEQPSAAGLAQRARRVLEALSDREPELADILEMIDTAQVNLDEAGSALQRLDQSLENDPARLEAVEQRLARAISLARKHGVEPDALPGVRAELRHRIDRIDQFKAEREAAEQRVQAARERWRESARQLHDARARAAVEAGKRVGKTLAELGMTEARLEFELDFDPEGPVSPRGADRVEMLFSANPGQSPKPLKRVASGGELSRLSLAMIIAAAEQAEGRVRIFDEIDAGVGGETAHAVGRFLKQASEAGQALCVTHLAQVAARADYQFRVDKQAGKAKTRVSIQRLDDDQRVIELARMLGSAESETSRRHAETMLGDS